MNLVIDIGNTRAKFAVFDGGRTVASWTAERIGEESVAAALAAWPGVRKAVVSSTGADPQPVMRALSRRIGRCLLFGPGVPVPLACDYASPETLGADRLAAAVGVATQYPGRNVLVVDFGTAVTADLVTADGTFRGGFISPGAGTRFRALHDYTARLPLCSPTDEILPLGDSTVSCIEQGVMSGLAYEIEGHIARIGEKNDDLLIIFAGGDAKYFVKRIKNAIFADCEPVLCGLNRILEYNVPD